MKLLREALVDVKRLSDEDTTDDQDTVLDVEATSPEDELLGDENADSANPDDVDVDAPAEGSDEDTQRDPSEPNADADSPWGSLPTTGGGVGDAPEGEGEGGDAEADPETDQELDAVSDKASEDPNRQGLIRTVRGAHLVYKRESDSGTFEELWLYNVTTLQDEMTVRKAILAGTDIPPNKSQSPDGSQTYRVWSAGNAEMLLISGLQN